MVPEALLHAVWPALLLGVVSGRILRLLRYGP